MVGHNWLKYVAYDILRKHNARVGWQNKISGNYVFESAKRVETSYIRCKFYTCNGILSYSRSVDEFVELGLVKSFCLPLITYWVGTLDLSATSRELAVCWNDCLRNIFGYKSYESVKLLQCYCSELPFEYICDLQKWKCLSCTSAVPARFTSVYQLKRHTLVVYLKKYGFASPV